MNQKAQFGRRRVLIFVIALAAALAAVAVILLVTTQPAAEAPAIVISNLKTCKAVENLNCIGETRDFKPGDTVYLTFDVYAQSASINGVEKVNFYEDTMLIGPDGSVVLEFDAATATIYDRVVVKPGPYVVSMADSITTYNWTDAGQYIVIVAAGSTALNQSSTAIRVFNIK